MKDDYAVMVINALNRIAGSLSWIGFMLFLIALDTCKMGHAAH